MLSYKISSNKTDEQFDYGQYINIELEVDIKPKHPNIKIISNNYLYKKAPYDLFSIEEEHTQIENTNIKINVNNNYPKNNGYSISSIFSTIFSTIFKYISVIGLTSYYLIKISNLKKNEL
jgi:hypothetical protein